MKYLLILLAIVAVSCKKSVCKSVTEVAYYSNGTSTLQRDTLFKDRRMCDDELDKEMEKNGKKVGAVTVVVYTKDY